MKGLKKTIECKYFTLYPLGDWHYGSAQCDVGFIKSHIQRIKNDSTGVVVLLGDLSENVLRTTKCGNIYEQVKDPHSQLNDVIKLLMPIQDKILFGIESNHSLRTFREAGISIDRLICEGLNIPFMGYSCYPAITARNVDRNQSYAYKVYFHHNCGGGSTPGGKLNAQNKIIDIAPSADAVFSAHTHTTSRSPERYYEWVKSGGTLHLVCKERISYSIGSALSWDGSYAEEKGYSPAAKEFISVKFSAPLTGSSSKRQDYEVYTS